MDKVNFVVLARTAASCPARLVNNHCFETNRLLLPSTTRTLLCHEILPENYRLPLTPGASADREYALGYSLKRAYRGGKLAGGEWPGLTKLSCATRHPDNTHLPLCLLLISRPCPPT
jgi:hypothetical protein